MSTARQNVNPLRAAWRLGWRVRSAYNLTVYRSLHQTVRNQTKSVVSGGPFNGMRYIEDSFCSALMPKLLGVYECELHNSLETAIAWRPDAVLDIGAAEGYYAVGLARRLPSAQIIAFEADAGARGQLTQLASLNTCDNMRICGLATVEALQKSLATLPASAKVLVVCDCEGAEVEVLQPGEVRWLQKAMIICELHEFLQPGVESLMALRFRNTHRVEFIAAQPRLRDDYRHLAGSIRWLPAKWIQMIIGEDRPPGMKWMVATPLD